MKLFSITALMVLAGALVFCGCLPGKGKKTTELSAGAPAFAATGNPNTAPPPSTWDAQYVREMQKIMEDD